MKCIILIRSEAHPAGIFPWESDAVSTKIDLLNVTLEVDYAPKYDFESGFEDAYEQFVKTK